MNIGIGNFLTLFEDWDEYDDYKILYRNWILGETPNMADKWSEDRWFGYQFLNGANPTTLFRCNSLPVNFPVTDEEVGNLLDRGKTLKQEIQVSLVSIFIIDY